MFWDFVIALGGVGLFLIGMTMLTDGLKALSGDALRRILARETRTPLRGAIAGALTTAVIQSSSATTVTAVGFVGAGLLTFTQGVGIILGANIGTTMTGWLVSLFGFKLKIGALAFPLVFGGALTRLLGSGRVRHAGWSLAGFGLLFVGIDTMQQGMASFQDIVTPDTFPGDNLLGRLQLVLIGVLITVITQSSSAGVAAALVALGTGTISFYQAAAMVIGMDIGTTFTAMLATIGGSTAMRRTGYAHVVYNLFTGSLAFCLVGAYVALADTWIQTDPSGAQLSLVAFHTLFNILGVSLALPVARPFAAFIVRLVPERGPALLHRLDDRLLATPAAAIDAAAATLRDVIRAQAAMLMGLLGGGTVHVSGAALDHLGHAIAATRDFVGRIKTGHDNLAVNSRHEAIMHALDHAQRLHHRSTQETRIRALGHDHRLVRLSRLVRDGARRMIAEENGTVEDWLDRLRSLLRRERRLYRFRTVDAAAEQRLGPGETLARLDAMRWLHRVAYHLWRMQHHLTRAEHAAPPEPAEREPAFDVEED